MYEYRDFATGKTKRTRGKSWKAIAELVNGEYWIEAESTLCPACQS